jgi:imidazolonepropionase-like amidohydrolase
LRTQQRHQHFQRRGWFAGSPVRGGQQQRGSRVVRRGLQDLERLLGRERRLGIEQACRVLDGDLNSSCRLGFRHAAMVPMPPCAATDKFLRRGRYHSSMSGRRSALALVLLVLSTHAGAETAPPPNIAIGESRVIRCGRLFESETGAVRSSVRVRVDTGRVVALETVAADAPVAAAELDLRNYTCLPGLIDLHVHLTERPEDTADLRVMFRRTRAEQRALSAAHASATVLAGFTSVRNVGAYIRGVDFALRDAIDRREVLGPRMQVSGFYLTIPGGGGDLLVPGVPAEATPSFVRGGIARGTEQFRRKAELGLADGADLLKVIASGAVLAYGGVPGAPEMNRAEISTVVEVAHARGRKVAAHAHGAQSVRDAILAGVDTVEHASLIDAEGIRVAREKGTTLVMDVYNGDYIDTEGRKQQWPAEFLRKNIETTEAQRQGFTAAHKAGVRLAFGTDAGVYPHGLNARQFRIMVERGMTPAEALQSATSTAARAMGWENNVGSLAPGHYADLIAVQGDPTVDIRLLESVPVVVQGGRILKASAP